MPDNPNPNGSPVAAAPTGAPDAQADKAIAAVTQAASAGREVTEFTLPDGQVFKGANTQDLLAKIAASKSQANEHITKIQKENAELRNSVAQFEAKLGRLGEALNPSQTDQFDRMQYFTLLENDPRKAQQYLRTFDPDYKELVDFKKQTQMQGFGAIFLSQNPDFPSTPENINLLMEEVNALGGLEQGDVAKRLRAAYLTLKEEGKIKPIRKDAAGPTPPPSIRTTSAPISTGDADIVKRLMNAPTEQDRLRILRESGRQV